MAIAFNLTQHHQASHCHCPYFKETEAYRGKRFCVTSQCHVWRWDSHSGQGDSRAGVLSHCLHACFALISLPHFPPIIAFCLLLDRNSLVVVCLVYLHNFLGQGFESDWGCVFPIFLLDDFGHWVNVSQSQSMTRKKKGWRTQWECRSAKHGAGQGTENTCWAMHASWYRDWWEEVASLCSMQKVADFTFQ